MKKSLVLALSLATVLACTPVLAEEGVTGRYVSTQNVNFMSAYPEYTFKMATFGIESLDLLEDGTYRLSDVENSFSGALSFADDGTYEVVPRGCDIRTFTGTYEAISDSGLLMVTLSAPTDVEVISSNSVFEVDTTDAAALLAQYGYEETMVMVDEATGVFDYIPTVKETPSAE